MVTLVGNKFLQCKLTGRLSFSDSTLWFLPFLIWSQRLVERRVNTKENAKIVETTPRNTIRGDQTFVTEFVPGIRIFDESE